MPRSVPQEEIVPHPFAVNSACFMPVLPTCSTPRHDLDDAVVGASRVMAEADPDPKRPAHRASGTERRSAIHPILLTPIPLITAHLTPRPHHSMQPSHPEALHALATVATLRLMCQRVGELTAARIGPVPPWHIRDRRARKRDRVRFAPGRAKIIGS